MKNTNLLLLIAVGSLAALPGCALRPHIKYDPDRMPPLTGPSGRELQPGAPLQKDHVTKLLGGPGASGLDPEYFLLDTNIMAGLFAPDGKELFSFFFLADTQIDDRALRFGPGLTQIVDKKFKIETTVRGFYQDHADVYYLGFVLKAIRLGLVMHTNIGFVAHLGDAMHVGRKPEVAAFNEMIGKFLVAGQAPGWEACWGGTWLKTPILLPDGRECWWFNVLGNHDVLRLGTFSGGLPIRVPGGAISSRQQLQAALEQTPPFNAASCPNRARVLGDGTAGSGYYWMDRQLPDGRMVRLVMLNTSERTILDPLIPTLQRGASYPSLSGEQFDWLRNTLALAQTNDSVGLVLVFGHYPLMEITVNRTGKRSDRDRTYGAIKDLLGEFPKVNAYFCGHLHSGSPPKEHRFSTHTVVEYISPPLLEFPKSFGLASVRQDPVTGKYSTNVRYYNLEDLMDLNALPPVEVGEESPPEDQQTRLADWLVTLDESTTNTVQRFQLLAKYAYRSAQYDRHRDLRTDTSLCFHPKFKRQLLQEYTGAQEFLLQLKRDQFWPSIQFTLETRPPSMPVAQHISDSRSDQDPKQGKAQVASQ